jgi:hypothetical protein
MQFHRYPLKLSRNGVALSIEHSSSALIYITFAAASNHAVSDRQRVFDRNHGEDIIASEQNS